MCKHIYHIECNINQIISNLNVKVKEIKCLGSHQYLNNLLEMKRMIGLLYRDETLAEWAW